ncbi:MAG: beta-hexosaminidase, partial [Novosphingobium sp.]|nr:beta-hexosaminidase [Novosphingobium sp.]
IALNCWANMEDMAGIAQLLPDMREATAARLERALENTGVQAPDMALQADLIAKRDALLQAAEARA